MKIAELTKRLETGKQLTPKKVCIFGHSKVGKTTYAAQALKDTRFKNIYWHDFENGYSVLFNECTNLTEQDLGRVNLFTTLDADAPYVIETAAQLFSRTRDTTICIEHGRFGCGLCKKAKGEFEHVPHYGNGDLVIIDGFSPITQSAAELAAIRTAGNNDKFAYYREMGDALTKVMSGIQSTKATVICLAHVSVAEDNVSKKDAVLPLIGTRNFSLRAAGSFQTIIYKDIAGRKFRSYSNPLGKAGITMGSRDDIDASNADVTIRDFL